MEKQKYHFIGICGASMSVLALWLKFNGHYVQGSDLSNGKTKSVLEKNNIKVFSRHNKENIGDCDVVVYSSAIKNNVELSQAKKQGLVILTRAQLLHIISKHYKKVIAISGAHGKTTTTAMLYSCLKIAGKNPTLHFGGVLKGHESGLVMGEKEYFITEACEYQNNFLHLEPYIGVVLNVEKEHLDFFGNFDNVKKSFKKFQQNSKKCVCFHKSSEIVDSDIVFGGKNRDYIAKNLKQKNGKYCFDCFHNNKFYHHFELGVVGKHNVSNALACISVCDCLGIENKYIFNGLKNFDGVKRRFENLGNKKVFLVHDYAHHPTEIKKSIQSAKQVAKNKKLLVVFQPHTFSRTKTLMTEFVDAFFGLDDVMIVKTYSAREKYDMGGSAKVLYQNIMKNNHHAKYCANFTVAQKYILDKINKGWAVIVLGAGNIDCLAENLSNCVDNMLWV